MLPFTVKVTVDDHKLTGFVDKISRDLREALRETSKLAAGQISDYIKNVLLRGEMLNDTTGQMRSDSNSSLPKGALRRAITVRASIAAGNRFSTSVFIRETGEEAMSGGEPVSVKEVALWLITGRGLRGGSGTTWTIVPTEGKWLKYYRQGSEFARYAHKTVHKGYTAKDFMRKGLEDNRQHIIDMVTRRVVNVTRRWRKA